MLEQERRKHPRVNVVIDISYDNDVVLTKANVKDLSMGGAKILTEAPLPVGTKLSLTFRGPEKPIDLSATVLRVTEEDPDDTSAPPGMAVQFFEVSASEEEALQQMMDWYAQQGERPAPEPTPEPIPEPELTPQEPQVQPIPEPLAAEESPSTPEDQRYITTQIITLPESLPDETQRIRLPAEPVIEVEAIPAEPMVALETTQIDVADTATFPAYSPESSNPDLSTIRISPEELEAKRSARTQSPIMTVQIDPNELEALQSAAQGAAGAPDGHDPNAETTVTLPEMPALTPEMLEGANDLSGESPAVDSSGERRRKKKRR